MAPGCLAWRANQLAAALQTLDSAHADRILDQLPWPEPCADAAYLTAAVAPPADPVRAAQVRELRDRLDVVHVQTIAGHGARTRATANELVERTRAIGYDPLSARARFERGFAADDDEHAIDDFREAYFAARRVQDSELAGLAASATSHAYLTLSRDAQAGEWARLADIDAVASAEPLVQTNALAALAATASARGDLDAALGYAEQVLALCKRRPETAAIGFELRAETRVAIGKLDGALADYDDALARVRARFGEQHPTIARLEAGRALLLDRMHRTDEAIAAATAAVAMSEQTTAADSDTADVARAALAVALKSAGRFDEALALADRTLAETRAHDGPRSYNAASDLNNRGELLLRMARFDDAIAVWTESADIFAEVVGPQGNEVAIVELNLANGYIVTNHPLDAEPHAIRARDIAARAPSGAVYAEALIAVGVAEVARRAWPEAKVSLTRGLAANEASSRDERWRARAWLGLARTLAAEGDRRTARIFAVAARDHAIAMGAPDADRRADAEALLKTL